MFKTRSISSQIRTNFKLFKALLTHSFATQIKNIKNKPYMNDAPTATSLDRASSPPSG